MSESASSKISLKTRFREIVISAICWCATISMLASGGSYLLYKMTRLSILKQIASIALLPFAILFFSFVMFFFGTFVIYCFLCLVPWRKSEPQIFIFGEDGSLPWWAALIWIVVIFAFLYEVIPNIVGYILNSIRFLKQTVVGII
jgi:hypothetical protein